MTTWEITEQILVERSLISKSEPLAKFMKGKHSPWQGGGWAKGSWPHTGGAAAPGTKRQEVADELGVADVL